LARATKPMGSDTFKNMSAANVIGGMIGKQMFGEVPIALQKVTAPMNWLYNGTDDAIRELLVNAMLDPKLAATLMKKALDKVATLSGVIYTNNDVAKSFGYDSDEEQVGVLAQEIEAVMPQVVKPAPFDLDAEGNSKSGQNYKTVQYDRLVPLLIEAINELQAKVKALEAK